MDITTTTITSVNYCGAAGQHIRVWAGGLEAKPNTCACGNYRFVEHRCKCGNVHENLVMIDLIEPIRRDWCTPEEDAAWNNL